jgi:DNA polymerase III epsilon subunit-like protein
MARYIVFDVETPNRYNNRISAIGISVVEDAKIIKEYFYFVNPGQRFDWFNTQLTGINAELVADAPTFPQLWKVIEPVMSSGILVAHNASFDARALNMTERYISKSKYRYFFPYGYEWWDTLKMARDTYGKQPSYRRYCERNGYLTKHKKPQVRLTAEILHRYLTGNEDFVESHTGLEDVKIESQIFAQCERQHKKMRRKLWAA